MNDDFLVDRAKKLWTETKYICEKSGHNLESYTMPKEFSFENEPYLMQYIQQILEEERYDFKKVFDIYGNTITIKILKDKCK